MMIYRSVAQHALTLVLALSISACLMDPAVNHSENVAISLTISSPSSASVLDTTDTTISLAGTAGSDMGISQISWINDRGGAGLANGSDSWHTANIILELGENRITVTAEDTAGATISRTIVVNRESGQTGSVALTWTAPTTRTDGSPLTDLAGFKIYYGRMSGTYDYQIEINNPGILTYVVENLMSGDWYFALAAYDSQGIVSDRSSELVWEIG